jgi:uncharacterized protein YhdP
MTLRKIVKYFAIAVGILVALTVIATVALRIAFPPAKLKKLVAAQVRQELNRDITIGDVHLGMGGISIQDLKLSEVPHFSAGTFLTVDRVTVSWALRPLLSKQVVVQSILLAKPQVTIIRMANAKTYNISDLGAVSGNAPASKTTKPSDKKTVQTSSGWGWRVDQVHLRGGVIQFEDRSPAHQDTTFSDIELKIKDFDPTRVQGKLTVSKLKNPVYTASDFAADWSLHDIDPTLRHLNGSFKLTQGPGEVKNLKNLAASSKAAKLALMPLVVLQSLDKLGIVKMGLPDFSRLDISHIDGDYGFKNGLMTINQFQIVGPQLTIGATGNVELAPGKLNVEVNLDTPKPVLMGEMNLKMHVGGTLDNPQTNLDSLKKKAFKATVKTLLDKPGVQKSIDDNLKKIFH